MAKLWRSVCRFVGAHQGAAVAALTLVLVGATGFTGYEVYKTINANKAPEVIIAEIDQEKVALAEEREPELPEFKSVFLTSESVEKDITIYLSDSDDNNITGVNFSVKLIKPEDAEKLSSYIKAVQLLNQKVREMTGAKYLDTGDTSEDADDTTSTSSEEISYSPELEALLADKAAALEAYASALNELEGETLVDDDANGVITKSDLDAGKFVALLNYDNSSEINYEPSKFENEVEVKDKVEFKVVAKITKKVEKDKASEDGQQKEEAIPVEKLENTLPSVGITKDEKVSYVAATSVKAPSVTYESTCVSTEGRSIRHTVKAKQSYTVTVVTKVMNADGSEASSTASDPTSVEEGGTYTVPTPAEKEGYTVTIDQTAGSTITINANTTITIVYTPVSEQKVDPDPNETTPTDPQAKKKNSGVKHAFTNFFLKVWNDTALVAHAAASDKEESAYIDCKGKSTLIISFHNTGAVVSSCTVNGEATTLKADGTYEYKIHTAGDLNIVGNVKFSDGYEDKVTLGYKSTGSVDENQNLTDNDGNQLYIDEKGTEAKVKDYQAGTTTYYTKKVETVYTGWHNIGNGTYYFYEPNVKATGTQVIDGVRYNFGSDGALLVSGVGIDVSKYQGNINWSQASSAISFAIIRCGYRGMYDGLLHEDPYFYKNMKNAKAAGVKVGIYIYSTALNEAEAVEEASMAVAMANAAGGCSYPIYLDMEDTTRGVSKLSTAQRNAIINAFCSTVQGAGYKAGVYASKNWFLNRVDYNSLASSINVWVAQYAGSCDYKGRYTMWQYTSKGSVPGISGNVDMNQSYF